jgi:enoyl-CoA hydratase/carnithine racemase
MKDRVRTDFEDGVAHVRLNRADKLNAVDEIMLEALAATIRQLETAKGLRAVVLSGEGRAFCAGVDLSSLSHGSLATSLSARTHGDANLPQFVAWGWRNLPVPVIAAVHGIAYGAGLQIMSGADIRIAHPDTRCSIMEMKWGIVPDMAGFALWRAAVRDDVMRELVYTGREFSACEAREMGFVTQLSDDPIGGALDLAGRIARKNPHAVRAAKRICNGLGSFSDAELLQAESSEQDLLLRQPNQLEAVRAEMEKRHPRFVD